MYLKLKSYLIFLALFILFVSGCATKKTQSVANYKPTNSRPSTFNFNQLVTVKELFYVFAKEPSGKPTSIITITSDQEKALEYFKHPSAIATKDCIKITITNEAALCQEKMWYARENKTKLVTRKSRNGNEVAAGTIIATVNAPIALAADILTFSPSLKHSRESLTHTFTESVRNVDELNSAKNEILYILEQQYKLKQQSEKTGEYAEFSSYNQTDSWKPIGYHELYGLVSGNTLIARNKAYCPDNHQDKTCISISILEAEPFNEGARGKSTIILPQKNKLITSQWGLRDIGNFIWGIDIGIESIPIHTLGFSRATYPFEDWVSVNKDRNIIRLNYNTAPNADHVFDVNNLDKNVVYLSIQKGQNNNFIKQAEKGNYKQIDDTGRVTFAEAMLSKAITMVAEAVAEANTKEAKEKFAEKRKQEKLDTDRQATACKKNSRDCYELVEREEKHATIKCLVGSDAGKTKDLYLNHNGEWEWSRVLTITATDTDLEALAKSICS